MASVTVIVTGKTVDFEVSKVFYAPETVNDLHMYETASR